MNLKKIGKLLTSKSIGTGLLWKKNLPGRSFTKAEKQWCRLCSIELFTFNCNLIQGKINANGKVMARSEQQPSSEESEKHHRQNVFYRDNDLAS